jgi:hypothetical protein
MFNGTIEMNNDYHAMKSIDSIFTVIENFRKKFSLEILDIKKEVEGYLTKYIFELTQTTITFSFTSSNQNQECEIITYDELDKFCDRYKYLNYYLTDFNFKIGDIIYHNHKEEIITEVVNDRFVKVKSKENEIPYEEYKCWGMRLN